MTYKTFSEFILAAMAVQLGVPLVEKHINYSDYRFVVMACGGRPPKKIGFG